MKKIIILVFILVSLSLIALILTDKKNTESNSLTLVKTIPLPGVNSRIDHLSYNPEKNEIYIAALGNNTVEIVNMDSGKVINKITGLDEPQGIAYIHESNSIFVSNGGSGLCRIFNTSDFKQEASIKLQADADNVRYDSLGKIIYVGYGLGGIAIIDALKFKLSGTIQLSGHPESFQFDNNAGKIYVNVPKSRQIEVIDLKSNSVSDKWSLNAKSNFPMCLDEENHRMFIGCRTPSRMLVYDYTNGKLLTSINIDSDVDDIFYDKTGKKLFLSCGSGFIDVIDQTKPDTYKLTEKISTSPGARTSLLINSLRNLVVACPATKNGEAKLLVYKLK